MKTALFVLLGFMLTPAFASVNSVAPSDSMSPSFLNETAQVTGFGDIRMRRPLPGSTGLPILLVHGVYGGASHRSFRELLPLLDRAGQAVYVVDLPGAGDSAKPKRAYRIEDLDMFVTNFIQEVIGQRTTVVAESILSASALKVSSDRPDLIRRLVLLSPTGVNTLHQPPTEREQKLYDRLYADENASDIFYQNLLTDNSLNFFLKFAFYDDSLVNENLLNDYRVMRQNKLQKYITISFVGGQLYRPFAESARGVFAPVLAIFGKNYESFADSPISTANQFKEIRPDFEYLEIESSGASVQREKPEQVAAAIVGFNLND